MVAVACFLPGRAKELSAPRYVTGWDSSVGIATRYELDGPGIESRWGARFFAPVQTGPGAHPASCTMGTGSLPVKRPGRDDYHPLPSSEGKNIEVCPQLKIKLSLNVKYM